MFAFSPFASSPLMAAASPLAAAACNPRYADFSAALGGTCAAAVAQVTAATTAPATRLFRQAIRLSACGADELLRRFVVLLGNRFDQRARGHLARERIGLSRPQRDVIGIA